MRSARSRQGRSRLLQTSSVTWLNRRIASVSAVTAACAVIRHDLFATLGGFDEALPAAYNDVDLCLAAGEAIEAGGTPSAAIDPAS